MLIGHYGYLNIQKGTEASKKKKRHLKGKRIFLLKRTHPIGLKHRVFLESARRQKLFRPIECSGAPTAASRLAQETLSHLWEFPLYQLLRHLWPKCFCRHALSRKTQWVEGGNRREQGIRNRFQSKDHTISYKKERGLNAIKCWARVSRMPMCLLS